MKLIGLIDAAARYDKRTVTIREGEELEVPEDKLHLGINERQMAAIIHSVIHK